MDLLFFFSLLPFFFFPPPSLEIFKVDQVPARIFARHDFLRRAWRDFVGRWLVFVSFLGCVFPIRFSSFAVWGGVFYLRWETRRGLVDFCARPASSARPLCLPVTVDQSPLLSFFLLFLASLLITVFGIGFVPLFLSLVLFFSLGSGVSSVTFFAFPQPSLSQSSDLDGGKHFSRSPGTLPADELWCF